jgi:hypothetical protein
MFLIPMLCQVLQFQSRWLAIFLAYSEGAPYVLLCVPVTSCQREVTPLADFSQPELLRAAVQPHLSGDHIARYIYPTVG